MPDVLGGNVIIHTRLFSSWDPDTWVATDALGRTMPTQEEVGNVKNDKRRVVGIFYITWHSDNLANLKAPYRADVSKVLEEAPEALPSAFIFCIVVNRVSHSSQ